MRVSWNDISKCCWRLLMGSKIQRLSSFLNVFFHFSLIFYSFIYNWYTVNWTGNINCLFWYILTCIYITEINTISSPQISFYHSIMAPYFTLASHPLPTLICILSNYVYNELFIYTFCHVYYFLNLLFVQYNYFKVHSCICMCWQFIPFYYAYVTICLSILWLMNLNVFSPCFHYYK